MIREYPPYPIPAVAALVIKEDKVLLVKRGCEPSKGFYSLPGGAIELGESIEEALKREVLEETGLSIEILNLYTVTSYVERDCEGRVKYHYVIIVYLARARDEIARPGKEVTDVRWVPLVDCLNLRLSKFSREVLRQFVSDILRVSPRSRV